MSYITEFDLEEIEAIINKTQEDIKTTDNRSLLELFEKCDCLGKNLNNVAFDLYEKRILILNEILERMGENNGK